ncbi:MAG: hypothetical protein IKZ50_01640 [Bacteroidales bacterium]|nr:hypothetical protein [Bacteroidales bacterium]
MEYINHIKAHFLGLINNPNIAEMEDLQEIREPSTLSKRASQLYSFCLKMRSGDIVLIPSSDSSNISIGVVDGDEMLIDERLNNQYPIARRVRWINQISKNRLEPGLYRAIGNHQAMTNISKYSESLERNFGSCFMMDGVCHYVITFNSEQIPADKFFGLGQTLLRTLQLISEQYDLQIDVRDINLTMNLNSPGRIDFKSTMLIAVLMMAILTSCSGGDIAYDNVMHGVSETFTELVQKVSDFFGVEGDNAQMSNTISDYLNGMDAQAVEKFNQNSMEALRQVANE